MLLPLVLAPHHSFTRTASTKTLGSAQPRPPRMDREDHAQITAGAPASALWPAARWRRPRPWQAQATPSRRRLRWRRSLPAAPADGVGSWTSPSQGQAPSRATPPAAGAGGQASHRRTGSAANRPRAAATAGGGWRHRLGSGSSGTGFGTGSHAEESVPQQSRHVTGLARPCSVATGLGSTRLRLRVRKQSPKACLRGPTVRAGKARCDGSAGVNGTHS